MLIALDISNTSIKSGVFLKNQLVAYWRLATEPHKLTDDYAVLFINFLKIHKISIHEVTGVIISCVVPSLRMVFQKLAENYLKISPTYVSCSLNLNIRLAVDHPQEVGADRIATAVAVHHLYQETTIAITFGTATVFDCVSKEGEYLGGAIAPGMGLALDALAHSAKQLYQIELTKPPKSIGTNTTHMMQSGIVLGYAGLVEGLVVRLKQELKSNSIKVVASGWLASVVAAETNVIDEMDEHLLLKGLQFIHEINHQ